MINDFSLMLPVRLAGPVAVLLVAVTLLVAGCGGGSASTETAGTASAPANRQQASESSEVSKLRASVVRFGHEGGKEELAAATAVVRAYLRALRGHDWPTACSLLAKWLDNVARQVASQRGEGGCTAGIQRIASERPESAVVEARSLRRHGKRTFVIYTDGEGKLQAMLMRPEGGRWKIMEVRPTPLTP